MRKTWRAFGLLGLLSVAPSTAVEPEKCHKPLDSCVVELRAAYPKKGVLGFQASGPGRDEPPGSVVVRAVPPGYPAHTAGLKIGDVLLAVNGKSLEGVRGHDFEIIAESIKVGEVVQLEVLREGKKQTLSITAGKPDPLSIEAWVGQHVRREHNEEDLRRYLRELRTLPAQKSE